MSHSRANTILSAGTACLLLIAVTATPVDAQQESNRGASSGLEEIVVTARKREEALADVPISITAIAGDVLQESNIRDLSQLTNLIPSFHFGESVSGNDSIFLRGLGSGINFGFENTVGQVYDGFFVGRSRLGRGAFMDVQQLEVLKGPQGALIGKNTSAGAINTRWRKPTDQFEAYITPTWEFEGDEGYTLQGAMSGPLAGDFRGRVAFRYDDKDGFMDNVTTGRKVTSFESPNVRATVDWRPSDDLNATLFYQYTDQTRIGRTFEFAKCTPDVAAALLPFGEDCKINLKTSQGQFDPQTGKPLDWASDTKSHFAGLTINKDFSSGTLTSLTGFSRYNTNDLTGAAWIPAHANVTRFQETYEQWSQEIRFVNSDGGAFDYIVGVYLQNVPQQKVNRPLDLYRSASIVGSLGNILTAGPPPARTYRSNLVGIQEVRSAAAFGELTWNLAEHWDLTLGARFTRETKEIDHRVFQTAIGTTGPIVPPLRTPVFPPASNTHIVIDERTEEQLTPNATLRWRPDDDSMLYASVSTGFKGGGFDMLNTQNQASIATLQFEDEQVTAIEGGGKFSFPDQRVQLNLAVFRSEFEDLQVTTISFNPVTGNNEFRTANAASAITQGIEADIQWRPMPRLAFSAAAAYLDATFDNYPDAPCFEKQTTAQGCVTVRGNLAQNLNGKELTYAPDWKFSADARYFQPLSGGRELTFLVRGNYTGRFLLQLDQDPDHFQDSYFKVDATIGLASGDGRWRLELIGRNLTNELTANFGNDDIAASDARSSSSFFTVDPPRSYTLQFTMRFGAGK